DIQKTNELTMQIEQRVLETIKKYEDEDGFNYMVESAISQVGMGSGNPQTDGGQMNETPHKGKITLSMREFSERRRVLSSHVIGEVRDAVSDFTGAVSIVEKDAADPPSDNSINIELKGKNYDEMLIQTKNIRTYINELGIAGNEDLNID